MDEKASEPSAVTFAGGALINVHSVRLVEAYLIVNDAYDADRSTPELAEMVIAYSLARAVYNDGRRGVRFGIQVFPEIDGSPYTAKVTYEGVFSPGSGEPSALFDNFIRFGSVGYLLPYVRETLASLTMKSGSSYIAIIPPLSGEQIVQEVELSASKELPT